MVVDKETGMETAIAAVLSQLDGIFKPFLDCYIPVTCFREHFKGYLQS